MSCSSEPRVSGSSQTSLSRSRSSTGRRPRPRFRKNRNGQPPPLELGDRERVAGRARIEHRAGLRHVAVELGERPASRAARRRCVRARAPAKVASTASTPLSPVPTTLRSHQPDAVAASLAVDRQARHRLAERGLHLLIGGSGIRPAAAGTPAASATTRRSRGTRGCRGRSS